MMNKDDSLLIAAIEDKRSQCQDQYILTHTAFLDTHQMTVAYESFKNSSCIFYGGYDDAERCIALFMPDYATEDDKKELLSVLRVKAPKGSRALSHRDYLGSLLALGIDRSVTGDILVKENGADIIVLSSMADFLLSNYSQAGRTTLQAEILPIDALDPGAVHTVEKSDTVASMRLDNMVASAFNLSRSKAQEFISHGFVFLNSIQTVKPDASVEEGDKVVLRGKGKAKLKEVGNRTRKDRIFIVWEVYSDQPK